MYKEWPPNLLYSEGAWKQTCLLIPSSITEFSYLDLIQQNLIFHLNPWRLSWAIPEGWCHWYRKNFLSFSTGNNCFSYTQWSRITIQNPEMVPDTLGYSVQLKSSIPYKRIARQKPEMVPDTLEYTVPLKSSTPHKGGHVKLKSLSMEQMPGLTFLTCNILTKKINLTSQSRNTPKHISHENLAKWGWPIQQND